MVEILLHNCEPAQAALVDSHSSWWLFLVPLVFQGADQLAIAAHGQIVAWWGSIWLSHALLTSGPSSRTECSGSSLDGVHL